MAYINNNEKILQAVLLDERLMKFGAYTPVDVGRIENIYQALDSDNCVINTVAQIIKRTSDGATVQELWKEVNAYLFNNV